MDGGTRREDCGGGVWRAWVLRLASCWALGRLAAMEELMSCICWYADGSDLGGAEGADLTGAGG